LKETALQSEPELEVKDSVSKPIEAGDSTVNGVKEPKEPLAVIQLLNRRGIRVFKNQTRVF
jgi:hypothetical protein